MNPHLKFLHRLAKLLPEEIVLDPAILANYASTSGWEDSSGKKTEPGAKPIGMAQWGAAIVLGELCAYAGFAFTS